MVSPLSFYHGTSHTYLLFFFFKVLICTGSELSFYFICRAADQQERNYVAEAESFPLYRPIQGSDLASNAKRAAFGWVGTYGNEFNDDWIDEMTQAFPNKGKSLIIMCASGGSMEPKPGAATGFQSRSLKAVYYLKKAGYKNVYHLEGGSAQWAK